jgi:glycerol kinase
VVSSSAIVADDCCLPGEEEPRTGTGWSVLQKVSEDIHTSHGNVIVQIRERVKHKVP